MLNNQVPDTHRKFYLLVLIGMCAVILSALAFEHIGGYQPCKLCLQQRGPWYWGIPLMALATVSVFLKWPAYISRGTLLVVGLVLIYSLYLAVHHSGVEWGWWEGPVDCGAIDGGIATTTDNFLTQLEQSVPPSCTDAALRIFGLSFAGWNAVASAVLAVIALRTAFKS